ncbi:50S ribosomal protein L5, partial [Flavobacteriales bacterium]|nr:50S ribosomal protein L5 [Flavobacteriales bacterium]
ERFEYKSVMQVPSITKICLNQGLGKAIADKKVVEYATDEMSRIVGQKAVRTISTKDVSNFKLRKGMPIGCRVTLRRDRMFDFLDRLIAVSLPRTRDFQGVNAKGFDGRGNFTFGIKEQVIFPEINLDEVKHFNGMDITIVTSANTDEEAKALLESFGFPFKKN